MKKIISLLLALGLLVGTTSAYNLSSKDQQILEDFFERLDNILEQDPDRAETIYNNTLLALEKHHHDQRVVFVLDTIKSYLEDFKETYQQEQEKEEKEEDTEEKEEVKNDKDIEEVDDDKDAEEDKKDEEEKDQQELDKPEHDFEEVDLDWYSKVLDFYLESELDAVLLEDVYIKDNKKDITNLVWLIDNAVLVKDNQKLAEGYVMQWEDQHFIEFNISNWGYKIPRKELVNLEIYIQINKPTSPDQIWELEFTLWQNPKNPRRNLNNWIRALSFSNGNLMDIDVDYTSRNQQLVLKSTPFVTVDDRSYRREAMSYVVNSGEERLRIYSFTFDLSGGRFVDSLDDDAEFKVFYQNDLFGKATKDDLENSRYITIEYDSNTSESINYISANTYWEFTLEIQNQGSPEGTRSIRLYDMTIDDGFGGQIDNLNDYSNSQLPTNWVEYRY